MLCCLLIEGDPVSPRWNVYWDNMGGSCSCRMAMRRPPWVSPSSTYLPSLTWPRSPTPSCCLRTLETSAAWSRRWLSVWHFWITGYVRGLCLSPGAQGWGDIWWPSPSHVCQVMAIYGSLARPKKGRVSTAATDTAAGILRAETEEKHPSEGSSLSPPGGQ